MNPIQVFMPAGEAREARMRAAIEADKQGRFQWAGNASDLPGDVQFRAGDKILNLELKDFTGKGGENSDLVGSILNGHLLLQTHKLRKAGNACAIVSLGSEEDMKSACMKSAYSRGKRGDAATDLMVTHENMVWDFEANCRGQNIGFWWMKSVPFRRILSNAHKILTDADLSRYAPKPMEGEEKAVALSILAGDGIGPAKAKNILQKFDLCLMVKDGCLAELEDCDGIGPKLASRIRENIGVVE
jgi:hypothetical protein